MTSRFTLDPPLASADTWAGRKAPRFHNVSCSQCGEDFGPGEHGFSRCNQHSSPEARAAHDAMGKRAMSNLHASLATHVVRSLDREAQIDAIFRTNMARRDQAAKDYGEPETPLASADTWAGRRAPSLAPKHEIISDGTTVWVNSSDGMCIGRFSRRGIDIHADAKAQLSDTAHCLDCTSGLPFDEAWERFKAGIHRHHGIIVPDEHKPAAVLAAQIDAIFRTNMARRDQAAKDYGEPETPHEFYAGRPGSKAETIVLDCLRELRDIPEADRLYAHELTDAICAVYLDLAWDAPRQRKDAVKIHRRTMALWQLFRIDAETDHGL